jgi:hypothetical protein
VGEDERSREGDKVMERLILRGLLYVILFGSFVAPFTNPNPSPDDHPGWVFLLALASLACSARQVSKPFGWRQVKEYGEPEAIQERVLKKLKEGEEWSD